METALLVVDDEQDFLDSMTRMLRLEGYEQTTAVADPTRVVDLLAEQSFAVAFLDITMPEMDGLELLAAIKERSPATECVMVTADDRISAVVKAVKLGAYDYLVKPITPDLLAQSLDRALEHKRLVESLRLRSSRLVAEELDNPEAFDEIVTTNEAMLRMLREAELHAASEIPILITGETGVGKELLARAVHRASRRARGPFVPVNMLALSPTLFESEFFGHVRGAFTGADKNKAIWARRPAAPCFSTRSGICPKSCRASCCASCRKASTRRSAIPRPCAPTHASSPPPTRICRSWWRRVSFARTCSIACSLRISKSRRCASGSTIWRYSATTSCAAPPRSVMRRGIC